MRKLFRALAVLMATVAMGTAQAGVVNYRLTLTVDAFYSFGVIADPSLDCETKQDMYRSFNPTAHLFGCGWTPGDQIDGRFQLYDDVSSLADGVYRLALKSISLAIGEVVVDPFASFGSDGFGYDLHDFTGAYGGTCGTGETDATVSGLSARFVVRNGVITSLCEQIRGPGGVPWLKLYAEGGFDAADSALSGLYGSYTVARVPEPATVGLIAVGMLGLMAARRRRLASLLQ